MSNYFCVDTKKEYLIYGAGGNGLKLIPVFKESDFFLKGFIDKRASSLVSIQGKRVWNLETLKELESEANNIIIIITTKNVFAHTDITQELAGIGFRQCIYKPLPILKGYSDKELEKISKVHDSFLIDGKVPQQQKLFKVEKNYKMYYKDRLCISKSEKEILAWMPLELLFNYRESDIYENLSMAVFFPLDGLYKLFLGIAEEKEGDILEDFFSYACEWAYKNQVDVTNELKESWIESRREVFFQMQEISDYDIEFFHRNAPEVKMGNQGKFHMLCSGRNRVVFLAAKGYRHVPVKMKRDDYEKWIHIDAFRKIQAFIEKEQMVKLFAPIAHPYLKDMLVENVDYIRQVCFPIAKYIIRRIYRESRIILSKYCITNRKRLTNLKDTCNILCDMNDEGACSRYLNACGFHIDRIRKDNAIIKLLDELFYQDINEIENGCIDNYNMLIIDDYSQIEERITNKKMSQVICVGLREKKITYLEKKGYVYKRTLCKIFDIDGMKKVSVYEGEE